MANAIQNYSKNNKNITKILVGKKKFTWLVRITQFLGDLCKLAGMIPAKPLVARSSTKAGLAALKAQSLTEADQTSGVWGTPGSGPSEDLCD